MGARLSCWRCGVPLRRDIPRPFPRLEQCKSCGADLHVCLQCRHYAPRYTNRCDHDLADPPREGDLANFCDYFIPKSGAHVPQDRAAAGAARSQLDALFGAGAANAGAPAQPEDPLAALKALFEDGPEDAKGSWSPSLSLPDEDLPPAEELDVPAQPEIDPCPPSGGRAHVEDREYRADCDALRACASPVPTAGTVGPSKSW